MTALKPYRAYRESGVEWLGEVPEHWDARRIKTLARPGYKTFVDGDWIESPYITSDGIRLIQTGNIGIGEYIEKGFRYISERTFHEFGCTEFNPGDVLICRLGLPVARACLAPSLRKRMITSVDVCILRPRDDLSPAYLVYTMSSHRYLGWVASLVRGSTRDRVSRSMLGGFTIPLPPLPEQTAIARYLDDADARIRCYIGAKEKLLALLEEQKQAVIHEAVTGRLDVRTGQPYPSYRESGVEWLGKVPEHWEVVPNKVLFRQRKVVVGARHGEFTLLSLTKAGVIVRDLSTGQGKFSADMGTSQEVRQGDLIFCLFDIPETPRTVGLSRYDGMITGAYTVLECVNPLLARFLETYYIAIDDRKLLGSIYSGLRNTIPLRTFMKVQSPQPPLPEQTAIARYLDDATPAMDRTIELTRRQIDLAEEYRTRLISDVVTGKLDVREAAAELPVVDPAANGSRSTRIQARSDSRTARSGVAAEKAGS